MRKSNNSDSFGEGLGGIIWGVIIGITKFFLLCILVVTYLSELLLKFVNKALLSVLKLD